MPPFHGLPGTYREVTHEDDQLRGSFREESADRGDVNGLLTHRFPELALHPHHWVTLVTSVSLVKGHKGATEIHTPKRPSGKTRTLSSGSDIGSMGPNGFIFIILKHKCIIKACLASFHHFQACSHPCGPTLLSTKFMLTKEVTELQNNVPWYFKYNFVVGPIHTNLGVHVAYSFVGWTPVARVGDALGSLTK